MALSYLRRNADKIMFIGNSLTYHFPLPDRGWFGDWGMAADTEAHDYAHMLTAGIAILQGYTPSIQIVRCDLPFYDEDIEAKILAFEPDLIICQMGDNAVSETQADFNTAYGRIGAAGQEVGAVMFAPGLWLEPGRDFEPRETYIENAATAAGMTYVYWNDIHIEANEADEYADSGVAWHPNTIGHSELAIRLSEAITIAGPLATGQIALADELAIWDTDLQQLRKVAVSELLDGHLSGGGTISTGGFTLTVPSSLTIAGRNTEQIFTETQTISPSSTTAVPLTVVDPVSHTGFSMRIQYYGVDGITAIAWSNLTKLSAARRNLGNNLAGPNLFVGRNSNGGAEGPAPAVFSIEGVTLEGFFWVDSTGAFRIHNAAPTGSSGSPTVSQTAGTVVGTQTSHIDYKTIVGEPVSWEQALANVRAAAGDVRRFQYSDGRFGSQEFSGLILDGPQLHRYGMDADAEHEAGKSLNQINAFGDLLMAVAKLGERVDNLVKKGSPNAPDTNHRRPTVH